MTDPVYPQQTATSSADEFSALSFVINQFINGLAGPTLVQVQSVTNNGGITPVGLVDVLPLVNQVDGNGTPTKHVTLYGLLYFRLQGGTNAVILDPQVGDIGLACFASRDISAVKAAKAQANPGSARTWDWADGIYIGGVLNGTPQQYVAFASGGITIVSPNKITLTSPVVEIDASTSFKLVSPQSEIDASTELKIVSPDVEIDGNVTLDGGMTQAPPSGGGSGSGISLIGPVTATQSITAPNVIGTIDVTGGGKSLKTHVHPGVQTGSGDTGPPV